MEDKGSSGKPRGLSGPRSTVVAAVITAAAVIVAALIGVYATSRVAGTPASSSPQPSLSRSAAYPGPRAVIEAYLAAINRRDWPKVWQLGGKNLGPTYRQMIAGFRLTRKDVLLNFNSHGDHITAQIAAYETNGTIQDYVLHYVIRQGMITSGYQTLLSS